MFGVSRSSMAARLPAGGGGRSSGIPPLVAVAVLGSADSVKLLLSQGYDKAWEQGSVDFF